MTKRKPARGALTYYRIKNADGLYFQETCAGGVFGPAATACLWAQRAWAKDCARSRETVEPVRVTPLTSAKRNRKRNG